MRQIGVAEVYMCNKCVPVDQWGKAAMDALPGALTRATLSEVGGYLPSYICRNISAVI